jgi:hypothetical protein
MAARVSNLISEHVYIHSTLQRVVVITPISVCATLTLTLTLNTVGLYLCISYDSQNNQLLTHHPNSINPIAFVMEMQWVPCEVRTEFLNVI